MGILKSQSPVQIFKLFHVSERSSRLLLPKFVKSKIMYNNFIYNASKILNFLYHNDIPYSILSPHVFKKRLKNHLLNRQNKSLSGDANWLQCNQGSTESSASASVLPWNGDFSSASASALVRWTIPRLASASVKNRFQIPRPRRNLPILPRI